ncbi:MAG TPA: class I SAM-dependent methyltransferase [Bacteroidia bacterium]|nr:class I SAM-dependent methyltransferase [Bacteroidia bacterium]
MESLVNKASRFMQMKKEETIQYKLQNSQYVFPYHYLSEYDGHNFHLAKVRNIGYEYMAYLNFVINKLEEPGDVVDFGTGDGKLVFEIKKRYPAKLVRGIDISEEAIAFARAFLSREECTSGDIRNAEVFNGYKFSQATCIEVLEHIPPTEINEFVSGMASHIKPGGTLLITVPSDNIPTSKKHFQHFNHSKLKTVLEEHFEIKEIIYLNKINFKVKLLKDLLVNRYFILNYKPLLNYLFKYYLANHFIGEKSNTRRIFCQCKRK